MGFATLRHFPLDELTPEENDRDLIRRLAWLEQIAIAEFVDAAVLNRLSFAQVVKLRTRAWGTEGEAKARLFTAAKSIAESARSRDEFVGAAQKELVKYARRVRKWIASVRSSSLP